MMGFKDKDWEDYQSGYSSYGDESLRYGRVDEGVDSNVIRLSPTELIVQGGTKVVGPAHLNDHYFGKKETEHFTGPQHLKDFYFGKRR
ncbi:hypothetical protein [Desulfosporosinus acidiphilus]|nr:hypothetical protein [Desulfosporosinus acidiphilus]